MNEASGMIVESKDGRTRVGLSGSLTVRTFRDTHAALSRLQPDQDLVVDLASVTRVDTAGAWSLTVLKNRVLDGGGTFEMTGATPAARALMDTVEQARTGQDAGQDAKRPMAFTGVLDALGRQIAGWGATFLGLASFLGLFLSRVGQTFVRPRHLRLTALVHHCEDVGFKAVPIVALMGFLIGVVLAFQGAVQLRQFGAEVFVVDLIAVSILRELGILLTAIIVAGRTASAFTAAIGSMKMREEIDAMRTLGLDEGHVLFVPRILALLLMLPILGLVANLSGLVGGALMSWIELGISPELFRTRLLEGGNLTHLVVGLVKAPFFALIIGIIGCHAGMQVQGNADSLGQQTSRSVVAAIFAVIVADALFSIFFSEIGI
jgi:phospholipid/cholesterol/gamma-HCH transport system permease protein